MAGFAPLVWLGLHPRCQFTLCVLVWLRVAKHGILLGLVGSSLVHCKLGCRPPSSPHLPPPPIHTSPHIHGAAPPRLSHQTTPPDPRQPYPTRSLTAQPHPTRSPTAQPHPTPYRGTHGDRSSATVPAPLPPPPPRKGPPRSNRATPREAWGLPQSASLRRRPVQSHLF